MFRSNSAKIKHRRYVSKSFPAAGPYKKRIFVRPKSGL